MASIRISNYKAFGDEPQGFREIKAVNVVVGRNNSGKSALLDAIEFAVTGDFKPSPLTERDGAPPRLVLTDVLSEADLQVRFRQGTSGGHIGGDHWRFAQPWLDQPLTWAVLPDGSATARETDPPIPDNVKADFHEIAKRKAVPLRGLEFRRVASDRDISAEGDRNEISIAPNGVGATTSFVHFLTKAALPRELVTEGILDGLNRVFDPDAQFNEIEVQQHDDGRWELFLFEINKGLVPLSQSGSGLKTVLLVLANLILIPYVRGKPLNEFVFVFEELENNLHPALQRRLFVFLRDLAVSKEFHLFVSTHSSAVIDLFSADDEAQVVHVSHDGAAGRAEPAVTYVHRKGILDDLDIRASDLLQANGVVWVEGPTDRLYFNRWLSLFTDGALLEGLHYQCVMYGGRLLAHLTAAGPEGLEEELFAMLRVNRNVALLGDSDKSDESNRLNKTKSRIRREIEDSGGFAWFTAGREVENYLHPDLVSRVIGKDARPIGQYEFFPDYMIEVAPGQPTIARDKVRFAERAVQELNKSHLNVLDLAAKLGRISTEIRAWNGL